MIIFKINHHHRITDMMNADAGFLQLFAEEHILVAVMLEVFVKRNTKHDIPLNEEIDGAEFFIGLFLTFGCTMIILIFQFIQETQVVAQRTVTVINLYSANDDMEIGIQVFLNETGTFHHDVTVQEQ